MSVVVNQTANEVYFGDLKVATADVAPGQVVLPVYTDGSCAMPDDSTKQDSAELALVCNYDSYADTNMTDSTAFKVKVGKYARLKTLEVGDVFTTDKFIGTYGSIALDAIFAPNGVSGSGAIGSWIAVGTRGATAGIQVKVIAKTTIYGANALQFRVVKA